MSLLKFYPGAGLEPRVVVRVDGLNGNDVATSDTWLGIYTPFAALPDTFAGRNDALRAKFREDFKHYYTNPVSIHPAAPAPGDPNIDLYTYRKPYEFHQVEFLKWLKANTGRDDFQRPQARKWNDYLGDQINPVVDPEKLDDEQALKQSFGQLAALTTDTATLRMDNKYNPMRWIAPINEIHHHEQASLAMLLRPTPENLARSEEIFAAFLKGDHGRRILLEYDIEFTVDDERNELGEKNIGDFLGQPLDTSMTQPTPSDLVGCCYWNTKHYAEKDAKSAGHSLPPVIKESNKLWLSTRFEPVDIQASVQVNFKEGPYRLNEFMVASLNQRPVNYFPPKPGAEGFIPSANDKFNQFVVDGGNSGPAAWFRARTDVFGLLGFKESDPDLYPIISGGEYVALPDTSSRQHLRGVIDLTNYYALARKNGFFPGQRGYWVNEWVGFEGDKKEYINPGEKHGLHWIGFIFENHGPFRVTATIHKLNAYVK